LRWLPLAILWGCFQLQGPLLVQPLLVMVQQLVVVDLACLRLLVLLLVMALPSS
jgi:hypothetical protein